MTLTPVLTRSPAEKREQIRNKVLAGLRAAFPMTVRDHVIELHDVAVTSNEFGPEDQKRAILQGATLQEPVKGTLVLKSPDGKVLETVRNFTLLHLPYFTERHTFIVDGNEYQVSNQLRAKPGVYTRRRANDELEAAFNLAKGANFRLSLDPQKGHPYMEYGTTMIPLYPILRKLGVPHQDIAKSWGSEVTANNELFFQKKHDASLEKLYSKVIHPSKQTHTTPEAKLDAVRQAYQATVMDPDVNRATLGNPHERVTPHALLDASKKLLTVYKSGDTVDDRDSLAFKTFHSVDDFLKERIQLDARAIAMKVKGRAITKTSLRDIVPAAPFSAGVRSFLTTSQLSAIPTQINPMELIDHAVKVTSLGEGGISNERAIPLEARQLHASHLGLLDPVRTPESFKAGVDIRTAIEAHRDDAGNLYTQVFDVKAKKYKFLSADDLAKSVVAFPGEKLTGHVAVMKKGSVTHVPASEVQYQIMSSSHLYSPASNLIPMMESIQGNRATMGSKMQTQALPLVDREVPLVQAGFYKQDRSGKTLGFSSWEHELGRMVVPTAPTSGKVVKVDHQFIYIDPTGTKKAELYYVKTSTPDFETDAALSKESDDKGLIKIPYETNFPFASKTYLTQKVKVKPGDKVEEGQHLADSNFTRDGVLALGKNMNVAYLAYYGLNSNDAVVISETAAKKFTSEHMYKEVLDVDRDMTPGRDIHRQYFGSQYKAAQYAKLGDGGVVKKGQKVLPHDLLIVGVQKGKLSSTDALLANFKKSLVNPYKELVRTWDHDFEGEVVDVYESGRRIVVTVKTREPMRVGDKLAGRFGNKGVVSHIVSDDKMVRDAAGQPIDVLYTATGVISRINPAQILETALAKVAKKTGQPIVMENFTGRDNVKWAKELLEKHGVKDKETVFDPISGKHIPGVLVGPQYTLRLFKTTDSNFSARGTGGYDVNLQPSKGGVEGAKGIGQMEFNALVAHNARNVLRETSTLKSQKNDEFWRSVQLGLPLPAMKSSFAFDKFTGMLNAAGIRVEQRGTALHLKPLTDSDVLKMSSGAIQNEKLVRAKDLAPERGGLFDPALTGGAQGTRWSHIDLAEPVVNPVFVDPARRLLGMTTKQFEAFMHSEGGAAVKRKLNSIDVPGKLKELRSNLKGLSGAKLDDTVKQIKYLEALQKQSLKPGDAYVLSKLPVLPPVMRPVLPGRGGQDMVVGDSNYLYQNAMMHNRALRTEVETPLLPPDERLKLRQNLYNAVGAVIGTHTTDNPKLEKRNVKGFLEHLTGKTTPKSSFFQQKIMKRQQDVSGRGTIAPDGALDMDEVGIPEEMLWEMFGKFVIGRLVRRGFSAVQAKEMVEARHPSARDALLAECAERPVMVNRAPSLHRYNVVGAFAKPVPGKTIRVNPFIEKGMNADYDGDTFQVHAPVLPQAVEEVKRMTLSNLVFGDRTKDHMMIAPEMEAALGIHLASKGGKAADGKVHRFKSKADALAAYKRGDLSLQDKVEIVP